jgi:hypothetical protein
MPDKLPIKETENIPITFVNEVAGWVFLNGVVQVALVSAMWTPTEMGVDAPVDLRLACRLRMDLQCAQNLHAALGQVIEAHTKTPTVN